MNANKTKVTPHEHTKDLRFLLPFFVVSEKTVKKAPEAMAVREGRPANEQGLVSEGNDLACFQEGSVWLNTPAEFSALVSLM